MIAEELKERLSYLGFSVIAAVDSAEEGIEIAIRERPDLVLMDIKVKGRERWRKRVRVERASVLQTNDEPLESIAYSAQNPNFRYRQAQI